MQEQHCIHVWALESASKSQEAFAVIMLIYNTSSCSSVILRCRAKACSFFLSRVFLACIRFRLRLLMVYKIGIGCVLRTVDCLQYMA